MEAQDVPKPAAGIAVDSSGRPTIDPTKNVLDLVQAANKRQDDLREIEQRYNKEIREMQQAYEARIADAESTRLNSNRAADKADFDRANDRAVAQAAILAAQVAASNEASRTLIATTATALAQQHTVVAARQDDRIASLERAQYMTVGKSAVVDPAIEQLMSEVRAMAAAHAADMGKAGVYDPILQNFILKTDTRIATIEQAVTASTGVGKGANQLWVILASVSGVVVSVVTLAIVIARITGKIP